MPLQELRSRDALKFGVCQVIAVLPLKQSKKARLSGLIRCAPLDPHTPPHILDDRSFNKKIERVLPNMHRLGLRLLQNVHERFLSFLSPIITEP